MRGRGPGRGPDRALEDLLRRLAPEVLGALVRRYGHFDAAEDAVQEALLAAATQWPSGGIPDQPRGWLITVASRRLTDLLRSEQARRRREEAAVRQAPPGQWLAPAADGPAADADDTLILLLMCCHPGLPAAAAIALTLRAVGGLTTAEIARAFLVPEATMTRRISRAKRQVAVSGEGFRLPAARDLQARLNVVLHVLYLIFTEGYAATAGPELVRAALTTEAIRLTRIVHRLRPDDDEVTGLLALMLLSEARRPARTGPGGELIPLAEQDRGRWVVSSITEGVALISGALARGTPGPYQLQAAIAAIHGEAASSEATDWPQIVALYQLLLLISDNPVVALNHAVAVAMAQGPRAGLALLGPLAADRRLSGSHRLDAVRAHLLELSGETAAAAAAYRAAAGKTMNLPQQRYLNAQAARLTAVPTERADNLPRDPAGGSMLDVEQRSGVTVLRLRHGKVNALDLELLQALAAALRDLDQDAAVVITGNGSAFSAGVDLRRIVDGRRSYVEEFLPALTQAFLAVFGHPGPVLAAIDGPAIAGGCVIAAACDVRIMSQGKIGLAELSVGVPFPTVALEIMRHATGPAAAPLVLAAELLDPAQAQAIGLVQEVTGTGELLADATGRAERMARVPAEVYALSKRQLQQPTWDRIAARRGDDEAVAAIWSSDRTTDAIAAYLDALRQRPRP